MTQAVALEAQQYPHTWQRFSPLRRLLRFALLFVLVLAVEQSLRKVEIIPEFVADAPTQIIDMTSRMWPIAWGSFYGDISKSLIETIHMATLGTLIGILLAFPISFLVAKNLTPIPLLNWLGRFILVSSRSVNSLVWALLFIAIFGPGAMAGMLAIAFRSIGFIGKMLGEALENTDIKPIEALQATGAQKLALIIYGYWPQIKPAFFSIALLRWDINILESAVLGLVGAGGLGMSLNAAIDTFQWNQVALILCIIFSIVIAVEMLLTTVRNRVL